MLEYFYTRIDKDQLFKDGYQWRGKTYYALMREYGANKEMPRGAKPRPGSFYMHDESHREAMRKYKMRVDWKLFNPKLVSLGDIEKALLQYIEETLLQDNEKKLPQDFLKSFDHAHLCLNINTLVKELNKNESNLFHRLGIEDYLLKKGIFLFEPISIYEDEVGFLIADSKESVLYDLNNYSLSKLLDFIKKGLIKYEKGLKQMKGEENINFIFNERIYNSPHIEDIPKLRDQIFG